MKTMFSSLSAFALLGVMSVADFDTSCSYDFALPATHPTRAPAENETNRAGDDKNAFQVITYDFIVAQLGQGTLLSEIEREIRDLTSFESCWQRDGRDRGADANVARLCAALAGPP